MEERASPASREDVAAAQRLRFRRILRGSASYACTAGIVVCAWLMGFLEGARAAHYLAAALVINLTALALVRTGANLRLSDPSLTGPLIIASLVPSLYVMYHVSEPLVRGAFVLMGSVAMLFGLLAFDLRGMLKLGGMMLLSYLVLLLVLVYRAPERVHVQAELVMVFAYTVVLLQIASLGSFIAGLRRSLREKNASLLQTLAELEELATRDPLTRLPNRRTGMETLEREVRALERQQDALAHHHGRTDRRAGAGAATTPGGLCVALLDVDHFKRVNDRHGHQAGDTVLKLLAAVFAEQMREEDSVARFGGEEFLLVLPGTSLGGAEAAVERLRRAVAHLAPAAMGTEQPVTVSIGLAAHRPGERLEETLRHADEALYRAKRQGRNRVTVWRDDGSPALLAANRAADPDRQAEAP
jgi:diguanylate cyclase (GGDEF)-like protein